jgi:hypothetical protein
MTDDMKIQGVIEPSLSGGELCRAWENRAFVVGAPLAVLKTDGTTLEIRYQLWDTENLKHVFQIEVERVGGPSTQVKWKKPMNPASSIPWSVDPSIAA